MTSRRTRGIATTGVVVALAVLALVSVLAADAAGGPAATILADAGAAARHGGPVASLVADLAGALVLGGAVLGGWVLGSTADRTRALLVVAIAAGVWTLAQLVLIATSYAVATGQPIGSDRFGSDLGVYLTTDLGAWLLASLVLAAVTTVVAVSGSSRATARAVTVAAGASLLAKAMTGHAAGTASHETATSTMLVHLLAVGVWVGGLAVLQLLPDGPRDDAAVVRGYSRLALVCWAALWASGVWALAVRMNGIGDVVTSAYVQLALVKALLLALLGGAGVVQRRLLADAAGAPGAEGRPLDRHLFRRLALLELALMGLAVALAAAMSSSPPPAAAATAPGDLAELLTGYPLPAAPGLGAVATAWRPDVFALAACCAIALAWWWPTAPRRARPRTILLVVALIAALVVQCGPLAVYGKVLFSAHLAQHVLLLTVVGPLLGAAWSWRPPRRAGVLVAALAVVLAGAAYVTPLVRLTLDSHVAHLALVVGATACGVLVGAAIAADRRAAPAAGIVLVAGGLVLALGDRVVAPSWFGATGRPWLADALADQQRAGWALVAWAVVWTSAAALAQARSARSSNSERTVRRRASRSSRSANGS
ncbi:bifunctional copper resistance protein CopD/cytochrome c oxidase assembly protein [Brachybacterium huguangmaarense]|uniref:Bifunctional copper resistance protein CopD/cytochrome c oxidase assembly protein n=1 Tax=Brachybacterium huguangmaarense TaxID=1652028 RepID=A0ABY6G4I9_9MICO|nr:bifunctional copper resistance protein CopD/cytochrome c oxidase assembly protein [Brachybacterium huguangmaarense]UYG18027.1 bifunctional copper resistance protein CopD/cytochrome c oxidase assembly protein [Brachybacterium huguangmaarense]